MKKYFVCILSKINPFILFKKGYTYGEVLLLLYDNPENRFGLKAIKDRVTKVDIIYFKDSINWLLKDELIIYERYYAFKNDPVFADVYRISYKGYTFVKDLKEKRSVRIINAASIFVACLSLAIASWINIFNCNKTTKVEIVQFPYRDSIKQNIAPPIISPWITPIMIAGKSSLPQGNP